MKQSYTVLIDPAAAKELDKMPADVFKRIDPKILELSKNPRPFGVKKLQDSIHRIRVGDWRIVYSIFDKEAKVVILRVSRRNEKTYR